MIRALAIIVGLGGAASISGVIAAVAIPLTQVARLNAEVAGSLHDTYYIVPDWRFVGGALVVAALGVCQVALAYWSFRSAGPS